MKRLLLTLLILAPITASAATPRHGMVAAAQPAAARAGVAMLEKGGNAFDAAAATALSLGVVEPGSSGIGGGGFFLLYIAREKRFVMIDAREMAPKLAGHGEVYAKQSSIDGPQAAGVPGLVAGVERLVSHYGRLKRAEVAAPAIRLARDGFRVGPRLARMIEWRKKAMNDAARRTFAKQQGATIRQPALADTLSRFARYGAKDFYRGQTAGRLVADMRHDGGLIRATDLAAYRAVERTPVSFHFHGYRFVTASLPSSGGMVLAEIFGMLKDDKLKTMKKTDRDHLLIEAMKRAYRDRNRYLGDPDFIDLPDDYLAKARLAELRASIDMQHATPSLELQGVGEPSAGSDTTHFSVIDREGNMVSATLSVNYGFGSAWLSPSTGILLNDEMDDFATKPGEPNAYGLVQGMANGMEPGKRMLSSMTPSIVIGPKRTLIVGTPGGSRIISMVLLAATGFMLDETPPASWINTPHFHHQFLPDVVQYEAGAFSKAEAAELKRRGHALKPVRDYGNMQMILWRRDANRLTGVSDRRGEGTAIREEVQR